MKQYSLDESTSVYKMVYWIFSAHPAQEIKKGSFQNITSCWRYNWSSKSQIQRYNKILVVLMPGNTIPILQPMDQEILSTFKS